MRTEELYTGLVKREQRVDTLAVADGIDRLNECLCVIEWARAVPRLEAGEVASD
ncbi:MAG: hypothetical protein ACXVH3_19955 [Solirubrobacteraceae bacterium]